MRDGKINFEKNRINIVLNCGSSSVKYKVFVSGGGKCIVKGLVEKIGSAESIVTHINETLPKTLRLVENIKNHNEAIEEILNFLLNGEESVIKNSAQIKSVGHRIVHGGKYSEPVLVDKEVKKYLMDVTFELAPLHNPYNYQGIQAVENILPGVPNVGCFDTAFHQTLPDYAFIYALPYVYFKKHLVRKYGFHGTSHQYVSEIAGEMLDIPKEKSRIITCHIGNGVSLAAVKGGKCVDTSMGFTPLEGAMMGTRSGDVDPAAVLHIMMAEELGIREMDTVLNKQSGLLGVSGISNDVRDILKAVEKGNDRARLAFEMFCYRIRKYIGGYISVLNGADAIVFTAGAGENSSAVREEILKNLENIGIIIDPERNRDSGGCASRVISSAASKIKVFVIPTDEELMISRMIDKIVK